jgi:hypothetical protein
MARFLYRFGIATAAAIAIAAVYGASIARAPHGDGSREVTNDRASTPTAVVSRRGRPYIVARLLERNAGQLQSYFATFSSHAQRLAYVPGSSGGMFVAWLYAEDTTASPCFREPPPVGTRCGSAMVRVARSTDNGKTWTPLLTIGVGGHSPPTLEADKAGNVYAFVNSWGSRDTIVYKFSAGNYSRPAIQARLEGGETDKSTSGYDPLTDELYYVKGDFTIGNSFRLFRFRTSAKGTITGSDMLTDAPLGAYRVYPHYPTMDVARDGSGLTVLAWTNTYESGAVHPGCSFSYYDIHYLVSPDHGRHWYGKRGLISSSPFPAGFPVDGTDSGPSFALLNPSELSTSCPMKNPHYNWLENVCTQHDRLLFVYGNASQGRETYRRVAWNPRTHRATNDVGPMVLKQLHSFTGFFSGTGTANGPIYFTSAGRDHRIITIISTDGGATWHTYATSRRGSWKRTYAVSGGHYLGPSGEILGAFTDSVSHNVWFFRTGVASRHGGSRHASDRRSG